MYWSFLDFLSWAEDSLFLETSLLRPLKILCRKSFLATLAKENFLDRGLEVLFLRFIFLKESVQSCFF